MFNLVFKINFSLYKLVHEYEVKYHAVSDEKKNQETTIYPRFTRKTTGKTVRVSECTEM